LFHAAESKTVKGETCKEITSKKIFLLATNRYIQRNSAMLFCYPNKKIKKAWKIIFVVAVALSATILGINLYIVATTKGFVFMQNI